MDRRYDPHAIEEKWQRLWKESDAYRTPDESDKPKFYALDFFPYPSGDGLSVGHCRNYVPTDAVIALQAHAGVQRPPSHGLGRLRPAGRELRHQDGRPPAHHHRAQHRQLPPADGHDRRCPTTGRARSPAASRTTTAGRSGSSCCSTSAGWPIRRPGSSGGAPRTRRSSPTSRWRTARCWRCGNLVTKKDLKQWYFRITDYAQRLLDDLGTIDWPEQIRLMQTNWIGRSEGAEVDFGRRGPRRRAHGLHHAARHALRRHLHGAGAGAPAGRRARGAGAAGGRRGATRTRPAARARSSV